MCILEDRINVLGSLFSELSDIFSLGGSNKKREKIDIDMEMTKWRNQGMCRNSILNNLVIIHCRIRTILHRDLECRVHESWEIAHVVKQEVAKNEQWTSQESMN